MGRTPEQCRVLKDHLGQLVMAGYLKKFQWQRSGGNDPTARWYIGSHCTDKWFLSEKSDGRPGEQSRRNVPRPIQRARVEELGFDKVWYTVGLVWWKGGDPEGQISLPVNMEGKEVMVTFIVVSSYSPYTAILGRPWIHTMGAVSSTLHVKVKFHTEQGVVVVRGSHTVARQCLVAVVSWKDKQVKQKQNTKVASL